MSRIESINISPGGIPKRPVETIEIVETGLVGDGHDHEKHRTPLQAISLLDVELLEALRDESGVPLVAGSLGENLTLRGVGVQRLGAGDRLRLGDDEGILLEITRVRPPCYVLDELSPDFKRVLWNRIGMYARVIQGGRLRIGDPIRMELGITDPRPLLREPKGGCIDGASIATSILAVHGLPPLCDSTPSSGTQEPTKDPDP